MKSQWLNDSLLFPQDNDPLLGQSPWRSKISGSDTETLGGFPVEFLIQVVRIALNILVIYEKNSMTFVLLKLKIFLGPNIFILLKIIVLVLRTLIFQQA